MKHFRIFFVAFLVLTSMIWIPAFADDAGATNTYPARGVIRDIASDRRTALIRHEAIPGYMPAMTMEFNVADTNELNGIGKGDIVAFELTVIEDDHWIGKIRKTGSAAGNLPLTGAKTASKSVVELKPGDPMPDYELVSESEKPVRFSDFRGKALAFTFLFTRCPLPNFCPLMDNNFAKARELILAKTNAPANWQLLSISFDPEFDTPAVLANYANFYRHGNADRWLFAGASLNVLAKLAPPLDLMVNREAGGSISHNLRTVVLDPSGRIYRQFDGNTWKPEELASALMEAAQVKHDVE